MKGLVERVGDTLGIAVDVVVAEDVEWLAPGRSAWILGGGGVIGVFGQASPALAEQYELPAKDPVYVAEIDLDAVALAASLMRLQVGPLPRFPSVTRDISILVADTLSASTVRRTVQEASPPALTAITEFDRYQGKGVPDGKISLSLRLTFRAPDRTLTDADVQAAMDAVLAALKDKHNAVQR
jgi:phenylalanyl-tRNA synthetase beta chain